MMKEFFAMAILALLTGLAGRGATREPQIGDGAPPLALETILQAPPGTQASWESLKGKVIVLEFWATWCGPCIAAIPHLNEMADEFKDQPIRFIAITDEKDAVVAPFLKKKPMHAWVGLDTDKSTFKDYGVSGIPHTVVVDRGGKIVAITNPSILTAQDLRDVLAGKDLALAPPESGKHFRANQVPAGAGHEPEPLFQILIRPTEATKVLTVSNPGSLRISGSSVLDVLAACCDVRAERIFSNCPLPDGRFEFKITTPSKQRGVVQDWLRRATENAFGLATKRETRETDVFVLTSGTQPAEHLTPTRSTHTSSSSSGGGSLNGVNLGIESLAAKLEEFVGRPVVDETRLTNRFDFQLLWDETGAEDLQTGRIAAAVREQLGLELAPAKRSIEVLVVEVAQDQQQKSPPTMGSR
ncbi:MAG TPA: TIGR03435 family protein [Verrucomicrobiae bacterium]